MPGGRALAEVGGGVAALTTLAIGGAVVARSSGEPVVATLGLLALLVGAAGCVGIVGPAVTGAGPARRFRWAGLFSGAPLLATVDLNHLLPVLGSALGASIVVPLVLAAQPTGRAAKMGGVLAAVGVLTSLALVVAYEPFDDLDCVRFCGHDPLLLAPAPDLVAKLELGLAVAALAWILLVLSSVDRRRSALPMLGIGAAALAYGARGLGVATDGLLATLLAVQLIVVGVALTSRVIRQVRLVGTRFRVRRQVGELAAQARHGSVEDWLRRTVQDPTLRVHFGARNSAPHDAAVAAGRAHTTVQRGSSTVATIEHREWAGPRVELALSPLITTALENDRLRALGQQQYDTLVASQRAIVRRGDDSLRRLQRDLHDGAQQHLLLLGLLLARAAPHLEPPDRQRCAAGVALTADVLAALRSIANDTAPATLDQLGLVEALRTLAETNDLLVLVEVGRWDAAAAGSETERTAYQVAHETLHSAIHSGATRLEVGLERTAGVLRLELSHDGVAGPLETRSADRIGAMRGSWSVDSAGTGTWRARIELPCA